MTDIYWIEAQPRRADTAAPTEIYLAGGGTDTPYLRAGKHYRAGMVAAPLFAGGLGYDANGWTGSTVPQTTVLEFAPSSDALLTELGAYFWKGAPVIVDSGEEAGGIYPRLLTGTIVEGAVADGKLKLTITDLSARLDTPVAPARFAGSGGIEGDTEIEGHIKRRSFGYVYNIEGRLLNKADNIYEFGDPAFACTSWSALRDKGRNGAFTVIAWQGSTAATLTALKASVAVPGGGVVAPSIAMAKWWTDPAGPLTADFIGTPGTGNSMQTAALIDALSTGFAGPPVTGLVNANALRPGVAGVHVDSSNETAAQAIDRLTLGVSLLWIPRADGVIVLRQWAFNAGAEVLQGQFIGREATYGPHHRRRVGYRKAGRQHSDSELAEVLRYSDHQALDFVRAELEAAAQAAAERIAAISADDILDRSEKNQLVLIHTILINRHSILNTRAAALGNVGAEKQAAQASVDALNAYLIGLDPAWNDDAVDTPIDPAVFDGKFIDANSAIDTLATAIQGQAGPAGQNGNPGVAGQDGIDGIDGEDGKFIEFVWQRAEAQPAAPSGPGIPAPWSDDPPAGSLPLWMSQVKQELDGSLVQGASWSIPIRHNGPPGADGAPGAPGSDGAPGQRGADGVTLYEWIAYAYDKDGLHGFTTGAPDGRAFIGRASNKSTAIESNNPADYTWAQYTGPALFGLVASGNAIVGPNYIQKVGGPDAWGDASAYSSESYTGGAIAGVTITEITHYMFGLNTDPTTDNDFTSIDYTWHPANHSNNALYIFENGVDLGIFGSYAIGDTLQIIYRNTKVQYLHNGVVKREVSGLAPNQTFWLDTSIYYNNFRIEKITWAAAGADGIPGTNGRDGLDGTNGAPGAAGANGQTSYLHTAYSSSPDGSADFTTGAPGTRKYLGILVSFNVADSEAFVDYTWSLIKGADGLNGANGTPGAPGANGQPTYVHIAYATSPNGDTGFSVDDPVGRTYVGFYVDQTVTDSTNPAAYAWSLVKGADGSDGQDGNDAFVVTSSYPAIALPATSIGVIKSGLPLAIKMTAKLADADVTGAATWSNASAIGCAVANLGGGNYRLDTVSDAAASFSVTATYQGYAQTIRIPISRLKDGDAANQVRDDTLINTTSQSYVTVTNPLSINLPAGKTLNFGMSEGYNPQGGSQQNAAARKRARFMYRNLTDGGAWTQAGAEIVGTYAVAAYNVFPGEPEFVQGSVSGDAAFTSSGDFKVYEVRLDMLRDGGLELVSSNGIFGAGIS